MLEAYAQTASGGERQVLSELPVPVQFFFTQSDRSRWHEFWSWKAPP